MPVSIRQAPALPLRLLLKAILAALVNLSTTLPRAVATLALHFLEITASAVACPKFAPGPVAVATAIPLLPFLFLLPLSANYRPESAIPYVPPEATAKAVLLFLSGNGLLNFRMSSAFPVVRATAIAPSLPTSLVATARTVACLRLLGPLLTTIEILVTSESVESTVGAGMY